MPRIIQLLSDSRLYLRSAPHAPPAREANLLMAHVLGWSEAQVLARDDAVVTGEQAATFESLVARRVQGEPVAYLTGRREFYGRSFLVDRRVLIPRPETEHLIATALEIPLPREPVILDVATGSGCIAVTLALERPGSLTLATDRSVGALAVAVLNAERLNAAARLRAVCGDWLDALDPRRVDLVVCNPPYIPENEAPNLSNEILEFEPHEALFAGDDGLAAYRDLFRSLRALRPATPVVCEIGRGQAPAIVALARDHGFVHRGTVDDYAGIPRVVVVNRR